MSTEETGSRVRIWDIWIRIFHWTFAISVVFLLVNGKTGFQFYDWHRRIGELVLLLLLFRILWGLFGSSNARLVTLVTHPKKALSHLLLLTKGRLPQESGHNPAGGWAVLLMLSLVGFQAVSGLLIADEDELVEGAFYGVLNTSQSEQLLELHYLNAKFLITIVIVHVLMIFLYLFRAGQNLILPMITGKMVNRGKIMSVKITAPWLGLVLFVASFITIGLSLGWISF